VTRSRFTNHHRLRTEQTKKRKIANKNRFTNHHYSRKCEQQCAEKWIPNSVTKMEAAELDNSVSKKKTRQRSSITGRRRSGMENKSDLRFRVVALIPCHNITVCENILQSNTQDCISE